MTSRGIGVGLVCLAMSLAGSLSGSMPAAAQDNEGRAITPELRLDNRICGDITIEVTEGSLCGPDQDTCAFSVAEGATTTLDLSAQNLPSSVKFNVNGQCDGTNPAIVSGTCEASLLAYDAKVRTDPSSPGEYEVDYRCTDPNDCEGINDEPFFQSKREFAERRTISFEVGLCDVSASGIDECAPECRVR